MLRAANAHHASSDLRTGYRPLNHGLYTLGSSEKNIYFWLLQEFPFVFALLTKAAGFQKLFQDQSSDFAYRKQNKRLLFWNQHLL